MNKFKKLFFALVLGILGFLFILSGFNLIQLSQSLILYSGLALLVIAGLLYFLL